LPAIPGFWDLGPHEPIDVEAAWREFVCAFGGSLVDQLIPEPRPIENADFIFLASGVVAELKIVETEFSRAPGFASKFAALTQRLIAEEPHWTPAAFAEHATYPKWFVREFTHLFRPPMSRILKKANRQLRATKEHFDISSNTGVLLLVNDGFVSLQPEFFRGLVSNLLLYSYSSIDCFVYLTVNRYVAIASDDTPRLLWVPTYSDRAPDTLVTFIDDLGRNWLDLLGTKIGGFTISDSRPQGTVALRDSRAIVVPGEVGRGPPTPPVRPVGFGKAEEPKR
jgi:hypothetical protein